MQQFLFAGFLFLTSCFPALAQISGVVKSADGAPIDGATIFINKSTIAVTTNSNGEFSMSGLAPGLSELIAYKNGFKVFRSPIRVQEGHALRVPLKLSLLNPRQITQPIQNLKERGSLLKDLKERVLGNDWHSNSVTILNESVLTFFRSGDSLNVQSDQPLQIENRSLGYKIIFYLDDIDPQLKNILSAVIFRFVNLTPDDEIQQRDWQTAREELFMGSARHFLSSLVKKNSFQQGFTIQSMSGAMLNADSLISSTKAIGYTVIKLKGKEKVIYDPLGGKELRVSLIAAPEDFAANETGSLLNEKSVSFEGKMKTVGIATILPNDFYPTTAVQNRQGLSEAIKLFQEKVYVQTDKPYYYPGEPLWFKGYINYFAPELKDSLSKVLYLELITPQKKIVLTRMLKIDSGMVNGDFVVPDSLSAGTYQLRAYTNLMRNFSETNSFQEAITVLDQTDKVDPEGTKTNAVSSSGLIVKTDKISYKQREKITVSFLTNNTQNIAVASNLSVAVTDATQVVPIVSSKNILTNYDFDKNHPGLMPASIEFPIERNFGFSGQLTIGKSKERGKIIIMEGDYESMLSIMTDGNGRFSNSGYEFYDSLTVSIQGKNEKEKPGKINLLPRDILPISKIDNVPLKIIPTQVRQRVISDYEVPRGVVTLKEVTVGAKRIEGNPGIAKKYGRPHRMYSGDRFKGTDMVNSLSAAIPSLKIVSASDGITVNRYITFQHLNPSGTQQAAAIIEPLIYVNNMFVGGGSAFNGRPAMNGLLNVNPATIEHVEVFYENPPNTMIGIEAGQGKGAGLIAIYTRPGNLDASLFKKFVIKGFSTPRPFRSPQYNSASTNGTRDFRSTLYWNPHILTSETGAPTTASFYASDLPGKYHVVVEGVTTEGIPLRAEFYFEVDE